MATVALKFDKPVKAVKVINDFMADGLSQSNAEQFQLAEELKTQKNLYNRLCATVQDITDNLKKSYETIFIQRNEEIARLAVEIARKVLMQTIQQGDYQIETIVKEILKNAPSQHDLVIHLNPKDLADLQKIAPNSEDLFPGVTLIADTNIGLAECFLESPRGIIKALVNDHLEQISKALVRAG